MFTFEESFPSPFVVVFCTVRRFQVASFNFPSQPNVADIQHVRTSLSSLPYGHM